MSFPTPLICVILILAVQTTGILTLAEKKLSSPDAPEQRTEIERRDRGVLRYEAENRRFLLKLYWERGYKWQGETTERKWCMEASGLNVKIQECDNNERDQVWFEEKGQIKTGDGSLCLTRVRRKYVRLIRCTGSSSQKWGGFKSKGPFEPRPKGVKSKCLTQHHHPRAGETVFLQSCGKARKSDTSKWNTY